MHREGEGQEARSQEGTGIGRRHRRLDGARRELAARVVWRRSALRRQRAASAPVRRTCGRALQGDPVEDKTYSGGQFDDFARLLQKLPLRGPVPTPVVFTSRPKKPDYGLQGLTEVRDSVVEVATRGLLPYCLLSTVAISERRLFLAPRRTCGRSANVGSAETEGITGKDQGEGNDYAKLPVPLLFPLLAIS